MLLCETAPGVPFSLVTVTFGYYGTFIECPPHGLAWCFLRMRLGVAGVPLLP